MIYCGEKEFYTYRRHLPHWRQDGAVYFVTFRLADSIPKGTLLAWRDERRAWFLAHDLTPGLSQSEWTRRYEAIPAPERRTFERRDARNFLVELDRCHGNCELRHSEAAAMVAGALQFHHDTRLRCGDFVVMPNHVHWLIQPLADEPLERLLQSVKQFSCKQINKRLGRSGTLWEKESYDHIVRNASEFGRIRKYVADNPAKAGLRPGEYIYHEGDSFDT